MTWERLVPTVGHWWWDTEERLGDGLALHECDRCGACVARSERVAAAPYPCTHPTVDEATPWEHDLGCQRLVEDNPGGMTLEQVGDALGLTRERVRQIEARALRKALRAAEREGIRLEDVFDLGKDDAA